MNNKKVQEWKFHPKEYVNISRFIVFYCGLVTGSFTHIIQGFFICIQAIIWLSQCQWNIPEEYR